MKAIEQIIAYLNDRGVLTAEHLVYLEQHGLWDRYREHREEEPDPAPYFPTREVPAGDDRDAWEPGANRNRRKRTGRGREGQPKGRVLEATDVARRLAARAGGWRDALDGLVQLGGRLAPCRSWQEAAVVVRNADRDALRDAIRAGLD